MADVEIDETEREQWTDAVDTVLDRLRDFFLPDDFPFDFTPESLVPLEALLLDRAEPSGDFLESVLAYVGQVALELTGGTWAVGRRPAEVPADAPFVRPDPELGLDPIHPLALLIEAGREGSGDVLTRAAAGWRAAIAAHPGWSAPPVPDRPIGSDPLAAWLAERERDFPRWLADHAGGDTRYDFSVESLDHLQELLRERFAGKRAELKRPENADLAGGAAWYLGEVIRRHRDGGWVAPLPGALLSEFYLYSPERKASSFPFNGIGMTVDPKKWLELRRMVAVY